MVEPEGPVMSRNRTDVHKSWRFVALLARTQRLIIAQTLLLLLRRLLVAADHLGLNGNLFPLLLEEDGVGSGMSIFLTVGRQIFDLLVVSGEAEGVLVEPLELGNALMLEHKFLVVAAALCSGPVAQVVGQHFEDFERSN